MLGIPVIFTYRSENLSRSGYEFVRRSEFQAYALKGGDESDPSVKTYDWAFVKCVTFANDEANPDYGGVTNLKSNL